MNDDRQSFRAGEWVGKVNADGGRAAYSVYLLEPRTPRVSFFVGYADFVLLQLFDDCWSDASTTTLQLSACLDEHPVAELQGHCLVAGFVLAPLLGWPGFLDELQGAATLQVRHRGRTSEMPVAGAHAALTEALRRVADPPCR